MNGIETYLLTEATDQYLMQRGVSNKKYYPMYLLNARLVWRDLFKNTIFSTQSQWQKLHKDEHGYYIDIPKGTNRIFSVSEVDKCGQIVALFYNNQMNVIKRPKRDCCPKCGCEDGLCDDVNSLSKTTKLLFTIDGIDYYETTYLKVCPNGDIIEYKEVPAKKYNTYAGDGGDYNYDYNNDYLIGNPPFADYTIVTQTEQKILCKRDVGNLEMDACGCPKNTQENKQKFESWCNAFVPCCKRNHCEVSIGDINDNHRGHVKVSECGTKIYYKPSKHRHDMGCGCNLCNDGQNTERFKHKLPHHLLLNFQTTGEQCDSSVLVPEYALEALWAGIDFYVKRFSNVFSSADKREAKYYYIQKQNDLISFLNPLSLEQLSSVQDSIIRF